MKYLIYSTIFLLGCTNSTGENNSNYEDSVESTFDSTAVAYVLGPDEGEKLLDKKGRTTIIKVSPESGAYHLTFGVQEMPLGSKIPVHKHMNSEEILFIHHGNGIAIVNGDTIEVEEGSTIFIPPGTWHAVENPNDSIDVLFIVTPQGLEKIFRGIGSAPGAPLKSLSEDEMDSLGLLGDQYLKKD